MSRLIDADALKTVLCASKCGVIDPATCECGCMDVMCIDDAPTIDAVSIHWTNIDEAMPEIGVMVLMHRPPKFTAVMSLRYWDDRFWWENNRGELTEVYDNDYWMPLPEPPKEVIE